MKRTKEYQPDDARPVFTIGNRVVTPDGVMAVIVNVGESSILVRFEPGESLGIYPHGVLRSSEKEVS